MTEELRIVDWFEIPVTNVDEAALFYGRVLGIQLTKGRIKDTDAAFFSVGAPIVSGALVQCADNSPYQVSACGTIVYLNGGKDLAEPLARVVSNGGMVIVPKTLIAPHIGYYALFSDADGNTIGLHSMA